MTTMPTLPDPPPDLPPLPTPETEEELTAAEERLGAVADDISIWDPNKNQWVPIVEKKI